MRYLIISCLLLMGCEIKYTTIPPPRWSRHDTSLMQFMQDRYLCLKEASVEDGYSSQGSGFTNRGFSGYQVDVERITHISKQIFISCMYAKGYVQHPQGTLAPPPGSWVEME